MKKEEGNSPASQDCQSLTALPLQVVHNFSDEPLQNQTNEWLLGCHKSFDIGGGCEISACLSVYLFIYLYHHLLTLIYHIKKVWSLGFQEKRESCDHRYCKRL